MRFLSEWTAFQAAATGLKATVRVLLGCGSIRPGIHILVGGGVVVVAFVDAGAAGVPGN
jgi:hypothetical protein